MYDTEQNLCRTRHQWHQALGLACKENRTEQEAGRPTMYTKSIEHKNRAGSLFISNYLYKENRTEQQGRSSCHPPPVYTKRIEQNNREGRLFPRFIQR